MPKKINLIEDQEKGLKVGEDWSGNLPEPEKETEVDDKEDEEEDSGD